MANTFISVKQIARETLPRLIDNLVFPNLIYRDIGQTGSAKKHATVAIRRPVKLTAQDFSASDGVNTQNIAEESVNVKLDRIATVDAEVSALEGALDFDSVKRLFIEPAAAALAEKINNDGLDLYRDIPYVAGEAGKTPGALSDFALAAYMLDSNKVPTSSRSAVWSPEATAAFKQIPALISAEKNGESAALRSGAVGDVFGISNYMTQAVRYHEAGNLSAGSGKIIVDSKGTNKDEVILTTNSAGGLTGGVVKGDVLKIGVKTYTVKQDSDAQGSKISVKLYPAANVSSGEEVIVTPSHSANLVFHPSAFGFVSRPLPAPAGVESYVTTYNGISLRVVRGYDMKYKREMLSMDVLYSFATLYPELACRYMG